MEHDFLTEIVGTQRVSTDPSTLNDHSHDWGTPDEHHVRPDVVVWPRSTEEVAAILSAAHDQSIPVTPYGSGTSTQGHAVPNEHGISLNLTQLDTVVDIRTNDFQVDVQAGVVGSDLNEALSETGLFFPSLPASGDTATIGGMIANDASGMRTVMYDEVADRVLRLQVVLPNGEIIETGTKAMKSSSGYNLTSLFTGSEGTLGIITEATLELSPRPSNIYGGRLIFNSRGDASEAVFDLIHSGIDIAKLELVDSICAAMVNDYLDADLPDAPMLFIELHADHGVDAQVDTVEKIAVQHDAQAVDLSPSGDRMNDLWAIRSEIANALDPYNPDLTPIALGDVSVPISEFAPFIGTIEQLAEQYDLLIPCFGHAGDGNVHYAILARENDPEHQQLCTEVDKQIITTAIEIGGTATGEHGIGAEKTEMVQEEFDTATIRLMHDIKNSVDPDHILNPGTSLPSTE